MTKIDLVITSLEQGDTVTAVTRTSAPSQAAAQSTSQRRALSFVALGAQNEVRNGEGSQVSHLLTVSSLTQ